MPGETNPVMAECLNMIAFQVVGNELAISLAVQAGQLELNVMTPVIMRNILQSIQILANFLHVFTKRCVQGITADEKKCAANVERNPSLAVFLSPSIGYLASGKIADQSMNEKRSVKEIALEKKILTPERAQQIFSRESLLGKRVNTKSMHRPRNRTQRTV
jgi:aspartate ammonia-lyase